MTKTLLADLDWYRTHDTCSGRGRITGGSARLLKAGCVNIFWSGMKSWTLTINAKGRAAIAKAEDQS